MNKKEILELYIQDLESKVPESDARNNRIEMLRNELKQVKNNDLLPDVSNFNFTFRLVEEENEKVLWSGDSILPLRKGDKVFVNDTAYLVEWVDWDFDKGICDFLLEDNS